MFDFYLDYWLTWPVVTGMSLVVYWAVSSLLCVLRDYFGLGNCFGHTRREILFFMPMPGRRGRRIKLVRELFDAVKQQGMPESLFISGYSQREFETAVEGGDHEVLDEIFEEFGTTRDVICIRPILAVVVAALFPIILIVAITLVVATVISGSISVEA